MSQGDRDLALVARANRGEQAALDEIYRQHRPWVFRLAMSRLNDSDEANDVVQDTFIKLFAQFPGFELRAAMTTVLHPLVHNLCRDRRLRFRVMVDIDTIDESDGALQVEAATGAGDSAQLLMRLTEEQREILTLRFGEDRSLPQVAEALGTPIGTIKSRMHRAIGALREAVAEQQPKRQSTRRSRS